MAAILNYHLVQLVGPSSAQLKLSRELREKVGWKPRNLLAPIISIYGSVSDGGKECIFLENLIEDERSFEMALFDVVIQKIALFGDIVTPNEAMMFAGLVGALKKRANSTDKVDTMESLFMKMKSVEDLTRLDEQTLALIDSIIEEEKDTPEEFIDPLMASVMIDPVLLSKTSRKVVDRKTILSHMMNDTTDPFTRQPLKASDLVPVDDLRLSIHVYIRERIRRALNSK